MKKYTYDELVEEVNEHFEDIPNAQVKARTIRFWVESRILPEPRGGSKWRYFEEYDLKEAIAIRRLQFEYGQTIKDLKKLWSLADQNPPIDGICSPHLLYTLVAAVENLEKIGGSEAGADGINDFKEGKRILIFDNAYDPPYLLVEEDQLSDSYFEKRGKVYKRLQFITDVNGKAVHFKLSQIEKYLEKDFAWKNEFVRKHATHLRVVDEKAEAKSKAEKIAALINRGIMTSPRYRFQGENYFSKDDIVIASYWLFFVRDYGLSYRELKLLRKRIEFDIENYFYTPEEGPCVAAPISYKFQKQVDLLNCCVSDLYVDISLREDVIAGHDRESSISFIRDYLNGFFFMCFDFTREPCIKKTPINRLTPRQLKLGLAQGRFTQREVEGLLKSREAEAEALKSTINDFSKGQ